MNPKLSKKSLRVRVVGKSRRAEEMIFLAAQQLQSREVIEHESNVAASERLRSYIKSKPARWFWMTIVASALSTGVVVFLPTDLYLWSFVRQILGALLVLWFPGYCLMKATFLGQDLFKSWSKIEVIVAKVCLSLCLSLAVTSLITLFLNYMPWGIQSFTVAVGVLGFVVIVATVALVRQAGVLTTFQK